MTDDRVRCGVPASGARVAPIPVRHLVIPAFLKTVDWRDQRLRFA
jgi:hypothetical protein